LLVFSTIRTHIAAKNSVMTCSTAASCFGSTDSTVLPIIITLLLILNLQILCEIVHPDIIITITIITIASYWSGYLILPFNNTCLFSSITASVLRIIIWWFNHGYSTLVDRVMNATDAIGHNWINSIIPSITRWKDVVAIGMIGIMR